ncbi:MAG: hypothetical protein HDQ91_00830 [Desulfovibrio sp.]|nr:hypothetical protein [Desulfovibrio sp.]
MKKYIYQDTEYGSLWQIRQKAPNLVFSDDTPSDLLAILGITVIEEPDPEPDPAEAARAELEMKIREIDAETSAAITAGFDYEIRNREYHFSYDSWDQQNFADTANACLLKRSGAQGVPSTVTWNGYEDGNLARLELSPDEFVALYVGGALAHKQACMEAGGAKKAALLAEAQNAE